VSAVKVLGRDALMDVDCGDDPRLPSVVSRDLVRAGHVVVGRRLAKAGICDAENYRRVDVLWGLLAEDTVKLFEHTVRLHDSCMLSLAFNVGVKPLRLSGFLYSVSRPNRLDRTEFCIGSLTSPDGRHHTSPDIESLIIPPQRIVVFD
jgi:hypothetical protein